MYRKRRKAFAMTSAIFIGFVITLYDGVRYFVTRHSVMTSVMLVFALLAWSLTYLLMLVFFEQLNSSSILRPVFFIAILLFCCECLFGFTKLYLEDFMKNLYTLLWDYSYDLLGIIIFTYGAILHYRAYRYTKDIPLVLLSASLMIVTVGFIYGIIADTLSFIDKITTKPIHEVLEIIFSKNYFIGDLIKIIGLVFFILAYILQIDFIYRLPFVINNIMVFNRFGLLIYGAQFVQVTNENKGTNKEDKAMTSFEIISAAVNALNDFITETTGSESPLRQVITEDKYITIERGEYATIAVMSDKVSFFLIQAMREFLKHLHNTYHEDLVKQHIDSDMFKDLKHYLKLYFPFLSLPRRNFY